MCVGEGGRGREGEHSSSHLKKAGTSLMPVQIIGAQRIKNLSAGYLSEGARL